MYDNRKVLLVDLGSVLFKAYWDILGRTLMSYHRNVPSKQTPLEFIQPVKKNIDLINNFDFGLVTSFEFYCQVTDILKLERRDISYRDFRRIYGEERVTLNEPMAKFLQSLVDVRLIIASNINEISWSGLQHRYGQLLRELFSDEVLSYSIRARKPQTEFWLECSQRANQRLDTLHLIDDLSINCDSFRRLGGKEVIYNINDHPRSEAKIKAMLFPHV